ncbi:MAG TPA: hypothetical protein VFZ31_00930 [Vicinamibacterales bacterium]
MSDSRRALLWKAVFEIILISIGVLIAMAVDQWRTDREHSDQARAALQRLKTEMESNRATVVGVQAYHVELRRQLGDYLDPKIKAANVQISRGMSPAIFEHAAWDLALATQALADIDSALAFEIARVYNAQAMYTGLTTGVTQAMFMRPPTQELQGFMHSVKVWLDDVVSLEPGLVSSYDRVLPMIDRALKD